MYEIYERLATEQGLKNADVAKLLGITPGILSYWKTGRSMPKQDTLKKIADFFNVTLEYLTTGKDSRIPLPTFEPGYAKVVALYGNLSEDNKKMILNLLEQLQE